MGNSKIIYAGVVLMDLTGDTVTPDKLLEGVTAHNAKGEPIVGTLKLGPTYKNLVPESTDTDGSIYNGTGYKDGYRLSSSGGVSSTPVASATHTGFMPVKKGDVIRIKIAGGFSQSGSGNYVCFYNSSMSLINYEYPELWTNGTVGTTETLADGSTLITGFTANQGAVTSAVAYFRVSLNPAKGANLTVTVNQEIT